MIERTTDYVAYEGRRKEDFQGTLHLVGKAIQKAPDRRAKAVLVKAYGQKDLPLFHGAHMFACVSMCVCVGVCDCVGMRVKVGVRVCVEVCVFLWE